MCGECIFPKTFMDKIINKTVKNFECNDSENRVTITFTDNTKLFIDISKDEYNEDISFSFG